MIIYGWQTRNSIRSTGTFNCPVCQSRQPFALVGQRYWFTLYFIPIIPLRRGAEHVQCESCGTRLDAAILQHTPAVGPASDVHHGSNPFIAAAPASRDPLVANAPAGAATGPATSGLSISSLILGLLSPLLLLACFTSLISSLVAIITGHLALAQIGRSAGRVQGRWQALTGLVLGYGSFAITVGAIILISLQIADSGNRPAPAALQIAEVESASAEGRLKSAERAVFSDQGLGIGLGNDDQAKLLAVTFATRMKELDEAFFIQGRKRVLQLSGGNFLTHCELHPQSCVFIVHVPSYRDYTKDAKAALCQLAWSAAQEAAASQLDPGDSLAVGLRGTLLYGDILIGQLDDDTSAATAFQYGKREDLLAFFVPAASRFEPVVDPVAQTTDQGLSPMASAAAAAAAGSAPGPGQLPHESMMPMPRVDSASVHPGQVPPGQVPPGHVPPGHVPPWLEPSGSESAPFSPGSGFAGPDPFAEPAGLPPWLAADPGPAPMSDSFSGPSTTDALPEPPRPGPEKPLFENRLAVVKVREIPVPGWSVTSLAFSPDGRRLAVAKIDQTIALLDVDSEAWVYQSDRLGDLGSVNAVAFSHDGQHLIAGGSKGATSAWRIDPTGAFSEARPQYRHAGNANCVVASSRFPFVLSGGRDGTVAWQPYDHAATPPRVLQTLQRQVLAAHLPTQGSDAAVTDGRTLIHFSLRTAEVALRHDLSGGAAKAAAFSGDARLLAIASGHEVQLVDTGTGKSRGRLQPPSSQTLWTVAFHPTASWLFAGGRGEVILWDTDTTEPLAVIDVGGMQYVQTLAITADGRRVAAVPRSAGQAIRIFQLPDRDANP